MDGYRGMCFGKGTEVRVLGKVQKYMLAQKGTEVCACGKAQQYMFASKGTAAYVCPKGYRDTCLRKDTEIYLWKDTQVCVCLKVGVCRRVQRHVFAAKSAEMYSWLQRNRDKGSVW